jgi:hypothetical protein
LIDNSNLLGCVQTILIKASNSVCFNSRYQLYSVHSYKPRKLVDLFLMSSHYKIFDSIESFACRFHNLRVDIIKKIKASNKQYQFWADLYKYHDILNVRDYFVIQISHERCPLKTNHKFQVSSSISFKVLQMIESNSYVANCHQTLILSLLFT